MVFDQRIESNALSERSESKGYHHRDIQTWLLGRGTQVPFQF